MTRAAVALTLVIAGVFATKAEAQERVVLWHAYGEAETRGLTVAVEAFEAETGITVEVVQNAFGAYESKL